MNFDNVTYKDFKSKLYRASFLSKRYIPLDNIDGFIKNDNELSLFDKTLLDKYKNDYKKIKIFDYSDEEYQEFKKNGYTHNRVVNAITILKFEDKFFNLEGKEFQKIRYYRNYYTKKYDLVVKEDPNSIEEVIEFINHWKNIRKDAHFQFFTGYDINFLKQYYYQNRDRIVSHFFYHDNKLIGFYLTERVTDTLYNQLFRKVDTSYSHLSMYVDYYNYKYIHDNIAKDFLVNMEGDVGEDGMKTYKGENFPIFKILKSIDVKIDFENHPVELFSSKSLITTPKIKNEKEPEDLVKKNVKPLF